MSEENKENFENNENNENNENSEILECMDLFSGLTQRTLSAFHLSDTENTLEDEMNMIKMIKKAKTRRLITAEKNDDGTYTRFFEDNHTDIVEIDDIKKESYVELPEEIKKIENWLRKDITPIQSLRLGSKIILTDGFKEIETPSEKIFFM